MLLAITTTATREEAAALARLAVEHRVAVCAQIDGPVTSVYWWQGKLEEATEFRILFKCLPEQLPALEARVLGAHPYAVPEWIVLQSDRTGEKYLNWAVQNSSPLPFS